MTPGRRRYVPSLLTVILTVLILLALIISIWSAADQTKSTVVVADTGPAATFLWGFKHGHVAPPDGTRVVAVPSATAAQELASKNASMGFVLLPRLRAVLERNPDARILPYQLRWPSDAFGIYAVPSSNITGPTDLAGRRVGLPASIPATEQMMAFLEQEHGVSRNEMNLTRISVDRMLNMSAWDDLDAVVVISRPPADARPVLTYLEALERRFGDAGLSGVFVISDPRYRHLAERVMDRVNRSLIAARTHRDQVIAYHVNRRGLPEKHFSGLKYGLTQDDRFILKHMTRGQIRSLEYRMRLLTGSDAPDLSRRLIS